LLSSDAYFLLIAPEQSVTGDGEAWMRCDATKKQLLTFLVPHACTLLI